MTGLLLSVLSYVSMVLAGAAVVAIVYALFSQSGVIGAMVLAFLLLIGVMLLARGSAKRA